MGVGGGRSGSRVVAKSRSLRDYKTRRAATTAMAKATAKAKYQDLSTAHCTNIERFSVSVSALKPVGECGKPVLLLVNASLPYRHRSGRARRTRQPLRRHEKRWNAAVETIDGLLEEVGSCSSPKWYAREFRKAVMKEPGQKLEEMNRLRCISSRSKRTFQLRIETIDHKPLTQFVERTVQHTISITRISTASWQKEDCRASKDGDDYRLPIRDEKLLRDRLDL